jgi:DNA-binding CsgD family transcriptional regulator
MNTETAVQEYLARGGAITRCPTRYVAPVKGCSPDPVNVDLIDVKLVVTNWRHAKAAAAAAAKAARLRNGPTEAQLAARQSRAVQERVQRLAFLSSVKQRMDRGESLAEVARMFGRNERNLRRALVEIGVQPPGSAFFRLKAEQGDRVLALRAEGKTVKAICAELSLGRGSVRHHLAAHGAQGDARAKTPDAVIARICELYAGGRVQIKQIAEMCDVSTTTVYKLVRDNKVPRRRP